MRPLSLEIVSGKSQSKLSTGDNGTTNAFFLEPRERSERSVRGVVPAFHDLNSGMRAFKRDLCMEFMDILPWGHSCVSTITLALLASGYSVGYVDIDYYPRKGVNTFHPMKDTYNYLTIVVRSITWFNPLKVFMPLAILLGLGGLGKLIYDNVVNPPHLTATALMLFLASIQVIALGLPADLIVKRRR